MAGVLALPAQSVLDGAGGFHQVRREIRKAAANSQDAALLRRAAEIEDISGSTAPEAYVRLANALEQSASQSGEYLAALERGYVVSLRENDAQRAAWFRERLRAAGSEKSPARTAKTAERRNGVWILGGREALAFVARGKEKSSPGRFLVDYSRAIVQNTLQSQRQADYTERIRQHFRRVATLADLGARKDNRVVLTVSRENRQTGKILNLLGWKMRSLKNRATMEADEKTPHGRRQESAVGLSVDGLAMQEALDSGKPFSFDLLSEWAPVLLDESTWRSAFYPKENLPGGFAEALARDPRLAKAYVGLSVLDEATMSALLAGVGLKELVEKFAVLLYQYSPGLAVGNRRVLVPGGEEAEPIWENLLGASPRQPGLFFRKLFEKDEGRMLAFYSTLSQLDAQHQRFCTRSAARLTRFYELSQGDPELKISAAAEAQDSSWMDLLREVPLDSATRVRFPGGPLAWQAPAPQVEEDGILLRLARSHRVRAYRRYSEVEGFLAVARIEAHRTEPLTEGAALLLGRNRAENAGAYPYFATLTALGERDFGRFFALRDKLRGYSPLELNLALGQLHALIELLCLAQQSGALDQKRSAEMFGMLCERFAAADSRAEWAGASLEFVRQMIPGEATDPDEAIRSLLLGRPAPVSFELNGVARQLDLAKIRHTRFQKVLAAQNVPALATLFRMYDAARNLANGRGDAAEHLRALEAASASLPSLEVPKPAKSKERKNLEAFQPKETGPILAKLRERMAGRGEFKGLVQELMAEISPQVTLALAGIVYAYFLNPDDLLVSEDPLLLRKHQFVPLDSPVGEVVFHRSDLYSSSAGTGSYFTGGFADFSTAVGRLAIAGTGQSERHGATPFGAQIASIRGTDWKWLQDDDLHLLGLKMRVAREWMVEAAGEPALRSDLAEAALGLLSLSRRAQLLNALGAEDWAAVWDAVSLSDLYFLGDAYLRRYRTDPWHSPVTRALQRAGARNDGSRLQLFGPQTRALRDCSHPHLLRLAPYEEYERYLKPDKMAERVAEFKLYLAEYMDRAGIPAAAFGVLAEPVAEIVFKKVEMNDMHDWRSVLAAFREMGDEVLEEALGRL